MGATESQICEGFAKEDKECLPRPNVNMVNANEGKEKEKLSFEDFYAVFLSALATVDGIPMGKVQKNSNCKKNGCT